MKPGELIILIVAAVFGMVLFEKAAASAAAAANPQGIAGLNRANANTSLMYAGGMTALQDLNNFAQNQWGV